MARLNPNLIPNKLRPFYNEATRIIAGEINKGRKNYDNLYAVVDDLFAVASEKLGAKQKNVSPMEEYEIVNALGEGLKSVADAMHSAEMAKIAKVLAEDKITKHY
jgi:hypothetical protein